MDVARPDWRALTKPLERLYEVSVGQNGTRLHCSESQRSGAIGTKYPCGIA